MDIDQLANQSVEFFMRYFDLDQTAARIVVQGFFPRAIDWKNSTVTIDVIEGGARLPFAALVAGAACTSSLLFASAQGVSLEKPSVSCDLPIGLVEQGITTCKPIDFAALEAWEIKLNAANISFSTDRDGSNRVIRTFYINPETTDEATLKWACNETDFAQLAQEPLMRNTVQDIFSLVRGCSQIVPIPDNVNQALNSTAAAALGGKTDEELADNASVLKPDVRKESATERALRLGRQGYTLVQQWGSEAFLDALANQTGSTLDEAELNVQILMNHWYAFREAQPTTSNLVLALVALFAGYRQLAMNVLNARVNTLVNETNRIAGPTDPNQNLEDLASRNQDLTTEVLLLRDINRGLLQDATNDQDRKTSESMIAVLKNQLQEIQIQVTNAQEKSLTSIQEQEDMTSARIADIQLEAEARILQIRKNTTEAEMRLARFQELEVNAKNAQEALQQKYERDAQEYAELNARVVEARNIANDEIRMIREAAANEIARIKAERDNEIAQIQAQRAQTLLEAQLLQNEVGVQSNPELFEISQQTSRNVSDIAQQSEMAMQTSPFNTEMAQQTSRELLDQEVKIGELEAALARANDRLAQFEKRPFEEEIFEAKPVSKTLVVNGISYNVPKNLPTTLREYRNVLLKLNSSNLQNRILWATSGKANSNGLFRQFKGAKFKVV